MDQRRWLLNVSCCWLEGRAANILNEDCKISDHRYVVRVEVISNIAVVFVTE